MSITITPREIAQRLHLSLGTVYLLLEQRQIPALRPRRKWIISRAMYERWESEMGKQAVA